MSSAHVTPSSERFTVHQGFRSRYLPSERTLRVYLPDGYRGSRRRYPVFYFQDGQNLFDPSTAYLGQCWHLHATLDRQVALGRIEPLILVGIDNAGEHRIDEYTPTANRTLGRGGKAVRYGRMLVREIKPWIDSHYRTLPEADFTGVGGSSLGGLVSLYLALRYPRVFHRAAVMSPSVWWDNRVILEYGQRYRYRYHPRIWLDVGHHEGSQPEQVIADTRTLRAVLVNKGWREGTDVQYLEDEHGSHDEKSWARRASKMLRFLFPAHRLNEDTHIW